MSNLFREIKWAYQRVVRGYDDRVNWGFDEYFLNVIPELKRWCQEYCKDSDNKKLNYKHWQICKETIRKIQDYENQTYFEDYLGRKTSLMMRFIGKNINFYWN